MHVRRKPHPAGRNASALHYGHWTDKNTVCREALDRNCFSLPLAGYRILVESTIGGAMSSTVGPLKTGVNLGSRPAPHAVRGPLRVCPTGGAVRALDKCRVAKGL